jgi:RNA polymerase subunit RPABC4/transcription elongation factor Spt4
MAKKGKLCRTLESHLCALAESGAIERDWSGYVARVQNPQFVCRRCGRVAGESTSLCDPERI